MNENNITTKRKETDLEITDFLWELIRNWRVIAVCLVIGAVLLCGYQYVKDSRNTKVTTDEAVEEYNKTLEEMEASLGAQDLDQVYGAVAIKKQLDEKSIYAKSSPLMAINAYEESVILLQYLVKSDSGNAAEIAVMYQDYLLNGEIASELIECSISSEKSTYVKETNESSFSVRIRGKNEEECKELAEIVQSGLDAYSQKLTENFPVQQLQLLSQSQNVIADQELAQLQDDTALAIKNLGEHLDTIKSKMNGNQLELYVEYTENQPQEDTAEPESDSAADMDTEETQNTAVQQNAHISVSKFVIGGILGVVLACIFVLLKYLFSGSLRSEEEIKTLYHSNILGTIRSSMKGKHNKIDRWYAGARYGKAGKLSLETEIELICANLKIICKISDNQKVYLTGSNLSEIPAGIIEKLVTECQTNGLTLIVGKEINYYAKALEEMAETGQVVLIEAMRKSRYKEMYQEVISCREHQLPVLGTIVVGI